MLVLYLGLPSLQIVNNGKVSALAAMIFNFVPEAFHGLSDKEISNFDKKQTSKPL